MNPAAWRLHAAAGTATAAIGALLALPTPRTAAPPVPAPGPPALAQVWPGARTIDVAATLPGGATLAPAAVLDARTVIVQVTTTGTTGLAVLSSTDPAHPRMLQQMALGTELAFAGVTVAGTDVYWITSVSDNTGRSHSTLYRADVATGAVHAISDDTGQVTFSASQYDLQVVDGRVYWNATRSTSPLTDEIRSVAVDGGPVTVRPLADNSRLTAWPWVVSPPGADQPVTELSLVTGARHTITPTPGEQLSCGPVWCRGLTPGPRTTVITDRRVDGSGTPIRINNDGEDTTFVDIAALDRFEMLAAKISNPAAGLSKRLAGAPRHLAVYDLKTRRHTAIAISTGEGTAGGWLWWATGGNEALTWHLLDLTTLH
jgi:hypothetical protein